MTAENSTTAGACARARVCVCACVRVCVCACVRVCVCVGYAGGSAVRREVGERTMNGKGWGGVRRQRAGL